MENNKLFNSLQDERTGGCVFSSAVCVPLLLSFVFLIVLAVLSPFGVINENYSEENWYLYFAYLLPQISFFLVVLFFLKRTKTSFKEFYRPSKIRYFLLAVAVQFGLMSLSQVNTIFVEFLHSIGLKSAGTSSPLPSLDGFGVVGVMLVIGVLPAILEESVFRGLMLSSMKKFGTLWCVLVCGGLFALFHENPAQTVYQFCCGCAFALIAVRSGSVLPTVLSHFLNNAFIIVMYKVGLAENFGSTALTIVSGVVLFLSLAYLIFIDKRGSVKNQKGKKYFFLWASIGILVAASVWISNLFL